MWEKQILPRAPEIQKTIGGNHAFFRGEENAIHCFAF